MMNSIEWISIYFIFILDQKRLELPHLITNSISSDKNLR
jgi:hypothetical protein